MLEIGSEHFTWDPGSQSFAGESSELEHELARQGHDRLDYRGGQWGFHMRSQRTGRLMWFQRAIEHRDADGDLTHVEFHACLEPGRRIRLLVFND
jgi:hypothetical protein